MADDTPETTQQETPASITAPVLRIGDETPAPGSSPAKPLEKGGQGKAIVRTRYPVDRFDHDVKDVPAITIEGVEVDRSKVAALLKAAEKVDVTLEEVDDA